MDIIAFHSDCPDGFCSAFIASKRWPNAVLLPVTHGQPPPDFTGKEVLVVDFSWKRAIVQEMNQVASWFQILDHHKTAEEELQGLRYCVFDSSRSGAQITWDVIFGGTRPWYVDYVADRDLWKFELDGSKSINAFIMTLPHTVREWSELDHMTAADAVPYGRGARLQVDHYIEKVTAQAYIGKLYGHTCKIVNAPYPNISDVLNHLCESANIGLGWFIRGDGMMQFSLRSIGPLDVSVIAKRYDGGGHQNAAGFQLSQDLG